MIPKIGLFVLHCRNCKNDWKVVKIVKDRDKEVSYMGFFCHFFALMLGVSVNRLYFGLFWKYINVNKQTNKQSESDVLAPQMALGPDYDRRVYDTHML